MRNLPTELPPIAIQISGLLILVALLFIFLLTGQTNGEFIGAAVILIGVHGLAEGARRAANKESKEHDQ